MRLTRHLALLLSLTLLLVASQAAAQTTPPPKVETLKLATVPEMSTQYTKLLTAAPTVGKEDGAKPAFFRAATVLLLAADHARRAGKPALAKALAAESLAHLGGTGTAMATLEAKPEYAPMLGAANGDMPGGDGIVIAQDGSWARSFER